MRKLAVLHANHTAIINGAEMINREKMKEVRHLLCRSHHKNYHNSMQKVCKVIGID